ncbi:ornithine decarboxylase [Lutibaculum baratangense]|uniref:ornithine decarboxylase n=1 Tax=Lutibaculum baratangense TaxID=1358440 RepID=UPI003CC71828
MPKFSNARGVVETLWPDMPVYLFRPAALVADAKSFATTFRGKTAYAVKTNPHPLVLNTLADTGISAFDVAAPSEFRMARAAAPSSELLYMHPVKSESAIREALAAYRIRHFALDHEGEAAKILREARSLGVPIDELTLFVRLATKGHAVYELSRKFGAAPGHAVELLQRVSRLGAKAGLCFHVGSQIEEADAYEKALRTAQWVRQRAGVPLAALDIGGGFPARYAQDRRKKAAATHAVPPLNLLMPAINRTVEGFGFGDVPVIAEPGRAIAARAFSVLVRVLLRKGQRLYINDGIWASLSDAWTGKLTLPVNLIPEPDRRPAKGDPRTLAPFRIMGATCDSVDILTRPFWLPETVSTGDWIEVGHIGAYSLSLRTDFNGLYPDTFVEVEQPFRATG